MYQDLYDESENRSNIYELTGAAGFMNQILMTGFCGTSSELLVEKADCKSLILPNDKVLDSQILLEEIERHDYKYIFSFGQKPNIKDKVYIETAAGNGSRRYQTDFAFDKLQDAFEAEDLAVRISDYAGTSFCNALYWNGLEAIRDRKLETKMVFLHVPFCKNMTAPEEFRERIRKGVENFCQAVQAGKETGGNMIG